jgi:hypothetical protein
MLECAESLPLDVQQCGGIDRRGGIFAVRHHPADSMLADLFFGSHGRT